MRSHEIAPAQSAQSSETLTMTIQSSSPRSLAFRNDIYIERLHVSESYRLEALHLVAGFAARRVRFGGGLSDNAVRAHCNSIDWSRAVIVGAFRAGRMDAAIEMFPLSDTWDAAEVAFTCASVEDRRELCDRLIDRAFNEAREKSCRAIYVELTPPGDPLIELLARRGALTIREGAAWVVLDQENVSREGPSDSEELNAAADTLRVQCTANNVANAAKRDGTLSHDASRAAFALAETESIGSDQPSVTKPRDLKALCVSGFHILTHLWRKGFVPSRQITAERIVAEYRTERWSDQIEKRIDRNIQT